MKRPASEPEPIEFTEEVGIQFLTYIRKGMTIREACRRPDMPDYLTVYDWLNDVKVKIGKKTFDSCYRTACKDRNQTWLDEVIDLHKGVKIGSGREDMAKIRKAEALSAAYLKIAGQGSALVKTGGGDVPTVIIQTFGTPKEDL